jgi:hypothetical protein
MSRLSCGSKPSRLANTVTNAPSFYIQSSSTVKSASRYQYGTPLEHAQSIVAQEQQIEQQQQQRSLHSARILNSANLVISETVSNNGDDFTTTSQQQQQQQDLDDDEQQHNYGPADGTSFAFTPISEIHQADNNEEEVVEAVAEKRSGVVNTMPRPIVVEPPSTYQNSSSAVNAGARKSLYRSSTISIISALSPGRIPDHLFAPTTNVVRHVPRITVGKISQPQHQTPVNGRVLANGSSLASIFSNLASGHVIKEDLFR